MSYLPVMTDINCNAMGEFDRNKVKKVAQLGLNHVLHAQRLT